MGVSDDDIRELLRRAVTAHVTYQTANMEQRPAGVRRRRGPYVNSWAKHLWIVASPHAGNLTAYRLGRCMRLLAHFLLPLYC